ncbi:MAG: peptide/nickel transport system permease protein [Granulosicoccus sp.]|jgi:peptide/nickel transport system permease protein
MSTDSPNSEPAVTTTSQMSYYRATLKALMVGLIKAFNTNKTSWIGLGLFAFVCVLALAAPWIAPHDPLDQNILKRLQGPSPQFWMGTDAYGRDIFSRILYGARISLMIGLVSITSALFIGTTIGLMAGYFGGRIDIIVMQIMDVLLAFPSLILGLIIVAMMGPSVSNLIIAIALTAIPPFARIARAPTIVVKEREFIEAGRALGYSHLRLMSGHILPNILPEVLVMGSLWLATAIRVEASLAFIGLGVSPPTATWGSMIREGFENILDNFWLAFFPSIAILIVVFALNLLGDGLRDAIDPRLRGEE